MDGTSPRVNFLRYTTSLAASESAMISDSHEDKAIEFCFREPQHRGAPCQYTTQPEVEERTSHEASAAPRNNSVLRRETNADSDVVGEVREHVVELGHELRSWPR